MRGDSRPGPRRVFAGDDTAFGRAGSDKLFGGPDDDRLNGEDGRDTILGQAGSDILVGGPGEDHLFGAAATTPSTPELSLLTSVTSLFAKGRGHACSPGLSALHHRWSFRGMHGSPQPRQGAGRRVRLPLRPAGRRRDAEGRLLSDGTGTRQQQIAGALKVRI